MDLNGDGNQSTLSAIPNEWSRLVYNGGSIGNKSPLSGLSEVNALQAPLASKDELTEQMNLNLINRVMQQ